MASKGQNLWNNEPVFDGKICKMLLMHLKWAGRQTSHPNQSDSSE